MTQAHAKPFFFGYVRCSGLECAPQHAPPTISRRDFAAAAGRVGRGLVCNGATGAANAPPTLQGVDFSDHASYWRFGMPAMMITDTSFFRNRNYHEAGDTPETLDYARMAKVVRAVQAVAMEF